MRGVFTLISQQFLDYVDALDIDAGKGTNIDLLWKRLRYEYFNDGDVKIAMRAIAQHCFYQMQEECAFQFPVKEHIKKLHKDKNAGYSGNDPDPWKNIRRCSEFGINPLHGLLTRMTDKFSRLENVRGDQKLDQVGEPLFEVYRDLGSYAIIYCCLLDEKQQFGFVLEGFTYGEAQ
jgi:hypothetical protein